MKNKVILVAMLFVQMFFTSENIQATEIQYIEDGKVNLCPAANDTN